MNSQQLRDEGLSALGRGDWRSASQIGARLLALDRDDAVGHFLAGAAALRLQGPAGALEHLQAAARLKPEWPEALAELARARITAGLVPEAVAAAEEAMALSPTNGVVMDTLGVIFGRAGFHRRARDAFARAVELMPGSGASRFNLASTLAFDGDIDAAEAALEECLAADPRQWRAHLFLSQLRRQTAERNHLPRLRAALAGTREQAAGLHLNMAIAKELEDLGDYRAAFPHLVAGKHIGGLGRGYSTARDEALFAAVTRCFEDPPVGAQGHATREPIFIIGMPRSGTTLVERILSNHPLVHSAGELRNFLVTMHRQVATTAQFLMEPGLPARMGAIDWEAVGRAYLASTRPGTGHTAHFVDKLPHNFLLAGFIALALPQAKIICLRRDPLDTCLSNFRQVFATDSPYYDYSYDLLDTGRYFVLFDRLMAHWRRVLPGRILELSYEALVGEQEENTRRLLDFCGLPWEEACLRFEQNAAPVATASAVQVRQPMYNTAIGRWKRYEPELAALRALLAAAGVDVDGRGQTRC